MRPQWGECNSRTRKYIRLSLQLALPVAEKPSSNRQYFRVKCEAMSSFIKSTA